MDISTTENLKTVRDSNQEMLDYFNGLYVAKLEQIQSLKTKQFELKIKIDELMKTLEVYSCSICAAFSSCVVVVVENGEKTLCPALFLKE